MTDTTTDTEIQLWEDNGGRIYLVIDDEGYDITDVASNTGYAEDAAAINESSWHPSERGEPDAWFDRIEGEREHGGEMTQHIATWTVSNGIQVHAEHPGAASTLYMGPLPKTKLGELRDAVLAHLESGSRVHAAMRAVKAAGEASSNQIAEEVKMILSRPGVLRVLGEESTAAQIRRILTPELGAEVPEGDWEVTVSGDDTILTYGDRRRSLTTRMSEADKIIRLLRRNKLAVSCDEWGDTRDLLAEGREVKVYPR